jgi:hypothetical protein
MQFEQLQNDTKLSEQKQPVEEDNHIPSHDLMKDEWLLNNSLTNEQIKLLKVMVEEIILPPEYHPIRITLEQPFDSARLHIFGKETSRAAFDIEEILEYNPRIPVHLIMNGTPDMDRWILAMQEMCWEESIHCMKILLREYNRRHNVTIARKDWLPLKFLW